MCGLFTLVHNNKATGESVFFSKYAYFSFSYLIFSVAACGLSFDVNTCGRCIYLVIYLCMCHVFLELLTLCVCVGMRVCVHVHV